MFGYKRQNYYKRLSQQEKHQNDEVEILAEVHAKRGRMPRLGTRKLHYLLKENGFRCGRDRLFKILREKNLLIKPLRRYIQTTNSKHWMRKYDNLSKTHQVTDINQEWDSDITYINTDEGTMYLSLITDKFSRKIVGFDLCESLKTEGSIKALTMAIGEKMGTTSLIHHSDRGVQYCSGEYQALLQQHNIRPSMTQNGDPYENALAERMNGILKNEFLLDIGFPTKKLALLAVRESIEIYNNERPHLSLGMKTPNEVYQKSKTSDLILSEVY